MDEWNEKRRSRAKLYDQLLSDVEDITLPSNGYSGIKPVYHLDVIRANRRDSLKQWLEQNGIQCGIYYPLPIHLQPIYREMFGYGKGDFPLAESLCEEVLSLPMFTGLTDSDVRYISEKIHEFVKH